jgi:hypothetical protein
MNGQSNKPQAFLTKEYFISKLCNSGRYFGIFHTGLVGYWFCN